jgi:hypothetical protein
MERGYGRGQPGRQRRDRYRSARGAAFEQDLGEQAAGTMADDDRLTGTSADEAGYLALEPADADRQRRAGAPPGCCAGRLARPPEIQVLVSGPVELLRPCSTSRCRSRPG